jgi:hypothetical protein
VKRRKQSTARVGRKSTRAISKEDVKKLATLSRDVALAEQPGLAWLAKAFASAGLEPRWKTIKGSYSIPELTDIVTHMATAKRGRGRPAIANLDEILTAAAAAKATKGKYTQIAARFGLTAKQLTDLVDYHKDDFDKIVKKFTDLKLAR